MSTVIPSEAGAGLDLQAEARKHLWMHFSRMGGYDDEHQIPIITKGEGAYVWDDQGNRNLDGLSGLFCVNAGHGRTELAEAAARQYEELDFFVIWSYAHPRAIELASKIASMTPGDLNKIFFTNGGAESVESALKLARNYHRMRGNGQKTKIIAREVAYHGTTLGALSATGITRPALAVRAARPRRLPRAEHEPLPLPRRPRPDASWPTRSRSASCSKAPRPSPR